MTEAMFYELVEKTQSVRCLLCPHKCVIPNGVVSRCKTRKNIDGVLYTLNYGKVLGYSLDPIEKKPLARFCPASFIFSVGTFGCNFDCNFCQNHSLVNYVPDYGRKIISATELVEMAAQKPSIGIAFTYNEPTVWYEYIYDTLKQAKQHNLKTVLVTNGFIEKAPLKKILPYISAMNIDFKSNSDEFYSKICKGERLPVFETIKLASKHCHIEISLLIIEGINSSDEETTKIAKQIAEINTEIPLHISAFHPAYKMMSTPRTTPARILRLCKIAQRYLKFVFAGNI